MFIVNKNREQKKLVQKTDYCYNDNIRVKSTYRIVRWKIKNVF